MKFATSVFLVSFLLLISCAKSGDDSTTENEQMEQPQSDDFVVTITNTSAFGSGKIATVYLSDENGQLLVQENLVANGEASLVSVGTQGMRHDLVMFSDSFLNGSRYKTVLIFEDIAEGQIEYNGSIPSFIDSDPLQLSFYNIEERPLFLTSRNQQIISPYSSSNGGTIDFSTLVGVNTELSGMYLGIRRIVDNFQRYYWDDNPPITNPVEIDYNDLPLLDNIISLDPPAGYYLSNFNITGFTPNDQADFGHQIYQYIDGSFNPSDSYGLPNDLFNRFRIEAVYSDPERVFTVIKSANTPFTAIPTASINLNVNNTSVQAFSATSTGNYDSFRSIYRYENTGLNIQYQVRVFGEQSPTITYNHASLLSSVFGSELNVSNLEFDFFKLWNYGDILGYDDFVIKRLFNIPREIEKGMDYESVKTF